MTEESQIRTVVGRRLRAARRCRGLTLQEVAEASGVTFQTVNRYECGDYNINVPRLLALSKALGVPVSEIVGGL